MLPAAESSGGLAPQVSKLFQPSVKQQMPTGLAWSSQGAVEDRNRNYASIMRNLNFSSRGWYDVQSQVDDVDDHVKRKVSGSPGWNSFNLLPPGVTGQGSSLQEPNCNINS